MDRSSRSGSSPADRRIEQLAAEADYRRQRYELYKAKVYSQQRPTSPGRLLELERASTAAQEQLAAAKAAAAVEAT